MFFSLNPQHHLLCIYLHLNYENGGSKMGSHVAKSHSFQVAELSSKLRPSPPRALVLPHGTLLSLWAYGRRGNFQAEREPESKMRRLKKMEAHLRVHKRRRKATSIQEKICSQENGSCVICCFIYKRKTRVKNHYYISGVYGALVFAIRSHILTHPWQRHWTLWYRFSFQRRK